MNGPRGLRWQSRSTFLAIPLYTHEHFSTFPSLFVHDQTTATANERAIALGAQEGYVFRRRRRRRPVRTTAARGGAAQNRESEIKRHATDAIEEAFRFRSCMTVVAVNHQVGMTNSARDDDASLVSSGKSVFAWEGGGEWGLEGSTTVHS